MAVAQEERTLELDGMPNALLSHALAYLSCHDLRQQAPSVNMRWSTLAQTAASWFAAIGLPSAFLGTAVRPQFEQAFPSGRYLADGAFKEVFQVWNPGRGRMEAVSVMDNRAIASNGPGAMVVVRQEIHASFLLSQLVSTGENPHFVETFQAFRLAFPPPPSWGREAEAGAAAGGAVEDDGDLSFDVDVEGESESESASYTYIRMELCDGGDLESYMRGEAEEETEQGDEAIAAAAAVDRSGGNPGEILLSVSDVRVVLFQMASALFSAQLHHALRHYDIKLLNFFVKKAAAGESFTYRLHTEAQAAAATAGTGATVFAVETTESFPFSVKLADYGTAIVGESTMGDPINVEQFTTLENTPIEFLLDGTNMTQEFSADAFALGLCLFHLLTGSRPYEEILHDVMCPPALVAGLRAVWRSRKKAHAHYGPLGDVTRADTTDTLHHTLYRFIVLFGLPSDTNTYPGWADGANPVWAAVRTALGVAAEAGSSAVGGGSRRPGRSTRGTRRAPAGQQDEPADGVAAATACFAKDVARYSIDQGDHPLILRARCVGERSEGGGMGERLCVCGGAGLGWWVCVFVFVRTCLCM